MALVWYNFDVAFLWYSFGTDSFRPIFAADSFNRPFAPVHLDPIPTAAWLLAAAKIKMADLSHFQIWLCQSKWNPHFLPHTREDFIYLVWLRMNKFICHCFSSDFLWSEHLFNGSTWTENSSYDRLPDDPTVGGADENQRWRGKWDLTS